MENDVIRLSDDGKTLIEIIDKTLNHIEIPDSVTEIGKDAFKGCTNLIPHKLVKKRIEQSKSSNLREIEY